MTARPRPRPRLRRPRKEAERRSFTATSEGGSYEVTESIEI